MKTAFKIILMAIAYFALFIVGGASGMIHPMCYAYIGAILPIFFAFVYLYSASLLRCFGVATIHNGTFLVVALLAGEADISFIIGIAILTALSEIIRMVCGYDTRKGVRWSFLPFAFSFFAFTAHWWTDTEGSLAAAVEEMPTGYDKLMMHVIDNVPMLIIVLLLTIPISILAMRLAERVLKKQTAVLK